MVPIKHPKEAIKSSRRGPLDTRHDPSFELEKVSFTKNKFGRMGFLELNLVLIESDWHHLFELTA